MHLFHKKLAAYSSMAAGLFSAENKLSVQAVYVDVIPDIVLDEHLDWAYMDLDNNGILDFQFFVVSYEFDDFFPTIYEYRRRLWGGIVGTRDMHY